MSIPLVATSAILLAICLLLAHLQKQKTVSTSVPAISELPAPVAGKVYTKAEVDVIEAVAHKFNFPLYGVYDAWDSLNPLPSQLGKATEMLNTLAHISAALGYTSIFVPEHQTNMREWAINDPGFVVFGK